MLYLVFMMLYLVLVIMFMIMKLTNGQWSVTMYYEKAGDFNSVPGELAHRILASAATDCWQVVSYINFFIKIMVILDHDSW